MLEKIKRWFKGDSASEQAPPARDLRVSGAHSIPRKPKGNRRKNTDRRAQREIVDLDPNVSGKIESNGPGKNVLVRNKYQREDTGTHETLKIIDDSMVDSGEETGIDPYNTGNFDRSRNWDKRFRK